MSRRTVFLSLLLLFSLSFSAWLIQQTMSAKPALAQNQPDTPDSFMIEASYVRMDIDGKPHSRIYSPKVVHYSKDDASSFIAPQFVIYSKERMPWKVSSQYGKSQHGTDVVTLWDNVNIHQDPGPNNREMTIMTSKLTFYPEQQVAETDQPVTITQPGTLIKSVGLHADMQKGEVQLLSQASGVYDASAK